MRKNKISLEFIWKTSLKSIFSATWFALIFTFNTSKARLLLEGGSLFDAFLKLFLF